MSEAMVGPRLRPFGRPAVQTLVTRISEELVDGGFELPRCEAILLDAEKDLCACGMEAFPRLGTRLEEGGARALWNRRLSVDRASRLSAAVAPYLDGATIDILCGDGSVSRRLAATHPLAMTERLVNYSEARAMGDVEDFAEFRRRAKPRSFDTALLCTVLHHEYDPHHLLDFACWVARHRVVIVENTVTENDPPDFHLLIDLFFNQCLNQTTLQSPATHGTCEFWIGLGSRYGHSRWAESLRRAPGVPLVHDIVVIDRSG